MGTHGRRLSLTGKPLGTPAYMAPEQVLGDRQVDHRADIYSVGALAYEMLSGEQVFPRKNAPDILAAHLREQPLPISEMRRDTPRAVAKLVMRRLEKEPDQRWPTARKLLKEIEASLVRISRTKPRRTRSIRASLRRAAAAIAFST
jgi:serine/threonine-protein kinase